MIGRLIPAAVERVKQHYASSGGPLLDDAALRFACTVGALEALATYSKVDLVAEPPVPSPTELPPPNVSALMTSDDRNQFQRLTAIVEENLRQAHPVISYEIHSTATSFPPFDTLWNSNSPLEDFLCECLDKGDADALVLAKLALELGTDPNHCAEPFESLLHRCVKADRVDFARLLLDAGAFIDRQFPGETGTPLMWAASSGRRGMAELLLSRGADASVQSEIDEKTAAEIADSNGHGGLGDVIRQHWKS